MSLHLIEMPLSLPALNRWAGQRNIGRGLFDEGLALHHLLGEAFGPAVLQPFRLLVAPRARNGTLYAYSAAPAEELRARAAPLLGPSETELVSLDALRSVERPETTWQEGMRLGFRPQGPARGAPGLRRSRHRTGSFERAPRWMPSCAETLRNDRARPREDVYLDWLAARLAPVADLERDTYRGCTSSGACAACAAGAGSKAPRPSSKAPSWCVNRRNLPASWRAGSGGIAAMATGCCSCDRHSERDDPMLKGRLGLDSAKVPHADRAGCLYLARGALTARDGTLAFLQGP